MKDNLPFNTSPIVTPTADLVVEHNSRKSDGWRGELRDYIDKVFKPISIGPKGVDREIVIFFVQRVFDENNKELIKNIQSLRSDSSVQSVNEMIDKVVVLVNNHKI